MTLTFLVVLLLFACLFGSYTTNTVTLCTRLNLVRTAPSCNKTKNTTTCNAASCYTAVHYSRLDCSSLHNSSKDFYDMYLFLLLSEYEVFKSAYKISDILEHSRMDSSNESFVNRDPKVVWFVTHFVLVCAVFIHSGVSFGLSLKNYFTGCCCQHNFWYNRSELTFVPLSRCLNARSFP